MTLRPKRGRRAAGSRNISASGLTVARQRNLGDEGRGAPRSSPRRVGAGGLAASSHWRNPRADPDDPRAGPAPRRWRDLWRLAPERANAFQVVSSRRSGNHKFAGAASTNKLPPIGLLLAPREALKRHPGRL